MLSVPLATLNTVILIASSATIVLALAALRAGRFPDYRRYMGLTILGGLGFLVVKAFEYGDKFARDLPRRPTIPGAVLHSHGPARPSRDRRPGREPLLLGSRRAHVAD